MARSSSKAKGSTNKIVARERRSGQAKNAVMANVVIGEAIAPVPAPITLLEQRSKPYYARTNMPDAHSRNRALKEAVDALEEVFGRTEARKEFARRVLAASESVLDPGMRESAPSVPANYEIPTWAKRVSQLTDAQLEKRRQYERKKKAQYRKNKKSAGSAPAP